MQPCATRVPRSSRLMSVAVPHAMSNRDAQHPPSLPTHSSKSPERMALRRLSWRRRQETSTSSQPSPCEHYLPEPGFPVLHRSLSEVSPVSPLSDRGPIIDADNRRLSRMGFVRQSRQDSSFTSPALEHISYTGPFNDLHPVQAAVSSEWQNQRPHTTYGQGPHAGYFDSSNDLYKNEDYNFSGSRTSSQQMFITSPTNYASSSQPLFVTSRPDMSSRMSRPPNAPHFTYPPVRRTTQQRDMEDMDEFTSPTDFALFVEATSSLDITPLPSPNPAQSSTGWSQQQQSYNPYASASSRPSHPYRHQQHSVSQSRLATHPPSQSRLAAPLPPLPRTRSSPAAPLSLISPPSSSVNPTRRQLSHSQMIAEALAGMGIDDRIGGSDDDDELPNYEQSQAEVAASRRREASARAKELEESWARARRRGV